MAKDGKLWGASDELRLIHAQVRVRSVTTRKTGRDALEEEMPPFLLALGFNAAIPARSRVDVSRRAPLRVRFVMGDL